MIRRYKEKVKKHFKEVLELKTSPHSIALGFAIGTAIAVLPTFGLGVLIGLLIIFIFKKVSKISLFAGLAVWNPFILTPLYVVAYEIGDFILKGAPVKTYEFWVLNEFFAYTRRFLLGNLIITIITTFLSYLVVYFIIKKYQK